MLLRDTNPADFRVPETARRQPATPANLAGEQALHRRRERDTALATAHERARTRAELFRMSDEPASSGLVKRADEALKKYRSSPNAMKGDDFAALARDMRAEALRREAMARAQSRVVETGKTIDTLIEATRAAPRNFAANAEAAREAIDRVRLPAKIAAAFRDRIAEIPEAALAEWIERDPDYAAELIKRREGPADAEHGLDRATLRLLGKQAAAAIDQQEAAAANAATIAALRTHADAADAIDAAASGEGDESGLTAWLGDAETIGPRATRTLRKRSKAAAKTVADRKAAAADLRAKLARGEDVRDANDDAVDRAYADAAIADDAGEQAFTEAVGRLPAPVVRRIAADLRAGDPTRALRAAELVVALEQKNGELVARLPKSLIAEAHDLAAASTAGLTAADAARYLREAADLGQSDRDRRAQDFDHTINGAALVQAIEQTFAIAAKGIAD